MKQKQKPQISAERIYGAGLLFRHCSNIWHFTVKLEYNQNWNYFWFIACSNILYLHITLHELPGEITVNSGIWLSYLLAVGNPVIWNNKAILQNSIHTPVLFTYIISGSFTMRRHTTQSSEIDKMFISNSLAYFNPLNFNRVYYFARKYNFLTELPNFSRK